jgi:hypothetical protein
MFIPWFLACFPIFLVASGPSMALPVSQPTVEPAQEMHQVQREKRGFSIVIDHERRRITVQAWFLAARRDPDAQRQLEAILAFWRQQNGRFIYRLKLDQQRINYQVVFDLHEAPGTYTENGFFMPDRGVSVALLNQVQVLPQAQFERLDWPRRGERVVGYAPSNFIYIASDQAQETWIGIHEAGHILGLGHHSLSMMAPEFSPRQTNLPRQAIRELLATADIIGRGYHARKLARYPVEAASVEHVGDMPQGFYTQGKVKRR